MTDSIGIVRPIQFEAEMRTSYLEYAMSVIVGRAFPDARDGLKPVQRRILYTMWSSGTRANSAYKKSARTIGEVLGKFHPHSEGAIYDAMVRMAQDFSLRYPLIDGQGNFGSIDNDPPAAIRYTEARLTPIAEELLVEIEKETVDFDDNFDGTEQEPLALPARLPNLLLNGAEGIAVGMATKIPPHNLNEVADGLIRLIDNPETSVEELQRLVRGPDFPTGGLIVGVDGIRDAYATGRGRVVMRARATVEESGTDRFRIVISELPYQVNKAALQEKIAELVTRKVITGITGMRDESDRQGLRVAIDIRSGVQPQAVLNQLYKHTALQSAFNVNMLALVDGQPRVLTLRRALRYYLEYRHEVITRRTQYDLRRAAARAHVLEGLTIALDHLDAVIAVIRAADTTEAAQQTLMDRFGLTEAQADAILALQLRRLVGLERQKIADELADLRRTIADLEAILADPARVRALIREELLALKERFGDERRTSILVGASESLDDADLVPDMSVAVVVTQRGYVKRMPLHYYRAQHRGGRGVIGATTRDDDLVARLFVTHTHDSLLLFTTQSRVLRTHVYELPDASRTARGAALVNFVALEPEERIATVLPLAAFQDDAYLIQATTQGEVKRTPLAAYATARQAGVKTMGLEPGDALCGVLLTSGQDDVIVVTASGMGIRFHETELRSSGRTSGGVRGIRLAAGDRVVGLVHADEAGALLLVTDHGHGKKTLAREFRPQGRGGQGVRALLTNEKVGQVVGCASVRSDDTEILAASADGLMLRVPLESIRLSGRYSQGTRLIKLKAGDRLSSIAIISQEDLEMAVPPEVNGASNGAALNGDAAPDGA